MGEYVWFHDVSWHAPYAVYFFLIGILAGLSFLSYFSWLQPALQPLRVKSAYVSLGLLACGGAILIGDLSQPQRFLNTINPAYMHFTSPLAWGALNIMLFGASSVAYVWFLRKGDEKMGKLLAAITALLALGLPIYTGYDLSVHQSRPMWNTPVMPVLFVALAVASGSAAGSFLAGSNEAAQKLLREYMLWSSAAVGIVLIGILGTTNYGGSAEELTFALLTSGTMGLIFVGFGVLGGIAAPVGLLLMARAKAQSGLLMVAAVLMLVGSAALRYGILMAPQHVQTLY
ncbi:MAG: polysulfide reductase NrfD [Rhodoferax sp.]